MAIQVAIAGGGLAGLTCAKSLVDAGHQVAIYEGLPFLGGRASTFRDGDGDWIEQGLHLFLGTYSEFKKLLQEIGSRPDDVLFWMTEVRLQDTQGPEATYGANPFLAPLKTVLGFLGQNDYLGPIDKLTLAPIAARGLQSMEALRTQFDGKNVTQWWQEMRGTEDVMERLLRPFCRAIQFTDAEQFSAYNFLGWLHHIAYDLPHSLLGGYRGARDELIFAPLGRYLTDRGAMIRTSAKLREIVYNVADNRISAFVLDSGERVEADLFVVAVPAWAFAPLIPQELRALPFFEGIANLPIAPAISVQLWFDRKVIPNEDFVLVAHSELCVYQDQSNNAYPFAQGSRVSATISPADSYLFWPDSDLVAYTTRELAKVQPEVMLATVVKAVVLKHEKHLIRPLPGTMSARPSQSTPVANLFLAGDWTQQDYFGSQEGAVRSGRRCFEAISGGCSNRPNTSVADALPAR
jgi:15-cis-phytoene desaturase